MRLSQKEIDGILQAASETLSDAKIYLYGSRTDDKLKGGDIDLLVVFPDSSEINMFKAKLHFAVALERLLGERRIDITATHAKQIEADPFLEKIWPTTILLGPKPERF